MEKYDAIIIGAGIAGLSLGSELSKKHKILVIEKDKIKNAHKPWTTERKIIEKAGLAKFITASFNKSFIKAFKKEKLFVYSDFVTLDDIAILNFLKEIILKNKSFIMEKTVFKKIINQQKNNITIETNQRVFSAKLLIDTTGVDSTLAQQFNIYDRLFYCPTYGGIYNYPINTDEICLVETIDKGPPISFLSIYPINKSHIVVYTDQYLLEKKDPLSLKKQHELNIRNCYLNKKLINKKMIREVYGIIPAGIVKKHAVNNVFFFGDNLLLGAPIAGSGFTNIIQHYKKFSQHLSNKLTTNKLTEKDLEYNFSEIELINRDFLSILVSILINISPQQLDRFLDALEKTPNSLILDALFMRMTINQLLSLLKIMINVLGFEQLAKILPKKEYMFIARQGVKIIEEITIEEIEKIFHQHHEAV